MKPTSVWALLFLLHSLFRIDAIEWQVDERCCQLYKKSKRPEACDLLRRRLETNTTLLEETNDFFEREEVSMSLPMEGNLTVKYNDLNRKHLRGNLTMEGFEDDSFSALSDNHRNLESRKETFVMRLHWERGFCWQEEMREREWCMQCKGKDCESGKILEIQDCQNIPQQRFEWLSNGGNLGRLKTASKNLCLTKTSEIRSNFYYQLRRCSRSNRNQLLARSSMGRKFELYPYNDFDKCVNQHHHPKWKEQIRTTSCFIARKWHTNQWRMIWTRNGGTDDNDWDDIDHDEGGRNNNKGGNGGQARLSLKRKECTDNQPCGLCQGDCDTDRQCQGSLKCYQRKNNGKFPFVPGCSGDPVTGRDYCYKP